MKTVEALTSLFRAEGRKVTPQRQRIFAVLADSTVHPTAEAVYERVRVDMPTISLRTVYQTLNDLAAMGELHAIDLGTGSTRFDPNLAAHHHLVCDVCGRVDDVDAEFPGVTLPEARALGFEVTATEIVFRGRCKRCTGSGDETIPPPHEGVSPHQHTGGAPAHG